MTVQHEIDDPRRKLLVQALSARADVRRAVAGPGADVWPVRQQTFETARYPVDLPSVRRRQGQYRQLPTLIREFGGRHGPNGRKQRDCLCRRRNSMILRSDSQLNLDPPPSGLGSLLIGGLRLLTGKLLSVSHNSAMRVTSATATIGIRGTGFYIEADPEQTYFCNCYGVTDIEASSDPGSKETLTSTKPWRPVYILGRRQLRQQDPQCAVHQPHRPGTGAGRNTGRSRASVCFPAPHLLSTTPYLLNRSERMRAERKART